MTRLVLAAGLVVLSAMAAQAEIQMVTVRADGMC